MKKEIISASGERAAIGGYLPQFDEFAWFVYLNLINNKLCRLPQISAIKS